MIKFNLHIIRLIFWDDALNIIFFILKYLNKKTQTKNGDILNHVPDHNFSFLMLYMCPMVAQLTIFTFYSIFGLFTKF